MKRSGDPWAVDGAVVALALLGLGVVAHLIVRPVMHERPAPAATVAWVVEGANEVRRRPAGGFEWHALEVGDALAAGDLVFVGRSSHAGLSLNDSSLLSIEENSLVRMPGIQAVLTLVKGSVDVQSKASEVTVQRGQTKVKLGSSSRARLSGAGAGAEIEVKTGDASLGLGGALEAGTRTTVSEQGVATQTQRLTVKSLAPTDGDRFYATSADPSVTFAWDSRGSDCELALKGHHVRRLRASAARVTATLEPGFYTWRVECRTGAGDVSSETRWLVVHQRTAPRLTSPRDGAVVDLSRAKDFALTWTRAPGASSYTVRLQLDEAGGEQITLDSARPRVRLATPAREGRYCSQVRASYDEGPQSPWSAPECFRTVTQPMLKAPQLLQPKRERVDEPKKGTWLWQLFGGVAYAAEQDSAITLRWEAVTGAQTYQVEIAEDRAFNRVVLKQNVERNYFRWFKIARRNYYWRVRGVDAHGREGVVSEPKVIGVETAPPVPLAPIKRQLVIVDSPEVELKWSANDALASFDVIVGKDAELTHVVARVETKKHSVTVKLPAYGEYHWRVTGVDLEGRPTPPAPTQSFVAAGGMPELQRPKAGEYFAANEVELAWTRRGVREYEVELRDANDRQRLTVPSNALVVRPGAGTWTWRVRGRRPDTAWSEQRSFVVGNAIAATLPASLPSSQPAVAAQQQVAGEPPPAVSDDGVRLLAGARAGFFSNFGAVATVRPGIDAHLRFALGPGELGALLSVDYYTAGARAVSAGFTLDSRMHAVSVTSGIVYALPLGRMRPYAALGLQLVPATVTATLDGRAMITETLVSVGGFFTPGCEMTLGPGAAFVEVLLALSSRPSNPRAAVDGSGVFAALGYRFSLVSSGKLNP